MSARRQPRPAETFERVFQEHNAFAWRLLARLGVLRRDVPDACQEVFLVVYRRLEDFDPQRGSLRSWVSGICVRVASDYRRRHPSRKEASLDESELVASSGPDAEVEMQRAWARLARLLDDMEPEKRQVFVLYELEAIPMNEVALILECPLQTAYTRLHAARRTVLAAFGGEPQP